MRGINITIIIIVIIYHIIFKKNQTDDGDQIGYEEVYVVGDRNVIQADLQETIIKNHINGVMGIRTTELSFYASCL